MKFPNHIPHRPSVAEKFLHEQVRDEKQVNVFLTTGIKISGGCIIDADRCSLVYQSNGCKQLIMIDAIMSVAEAADSND